jgi:Patatin-like phospholipase
MIEDQCPPVPLERVLAEELIEIQQVRESRLLPRRPGVTRDPAARPEAPIAGKADTAEPAWWEDKNTADWVKAVNDAHAANLVGLAFSGGGIRSATFNLGVLQALAELKLLHRVDYLSTVSGGGYIGGWLAAWTKRLGSFGKVQKQLATNRVHQKDDKEPPPIRFLRMFSNYLTPKLGILSGDTLAMAAIYLRNMLLNQVVVLAVMTLLLLLPRAIVDMISLTNGTQWNEWVWVVSGGLLLMAFLVIFNNMSSLDSRQAHALTWLTEQKWILRLVCGPLLFVAILAALLPARESRAADLPFGRTTMWGGAIYVVLWLVVSALADGFNRWNKWRAEERARDVEPIQGSGTADLPTVPDTPRPVPVRRRLWNLLVTSLGAAGAGALAGCLYAFLSEGWWCWNDPKALTIGAPLVLGIFLLAGALHIGLMGTVFHDSAREWWGRLGGWLLLLGIVWTAIFWVALYFPDFIQNDKLVSAARKAIAARYLTPAWILTTLASVLAGKSTASGEPGKQTWKDWIAKVGPYVFIAGLVCWISWCIDRIGGNYFLSAVAGRNKDSFSLNALKYSDPSNVLEIWIKSYPIYAAILICAGVAIVMAWRVDVNQFSMHLFYRNRLVRCYLGASNGKRYPNQFTGFDLADDMPLKDLRNNNGYDGPYPIINSSLNLVKGKDLAWQERKAESFVMTPQFCGYDVWLEEQDSPLLIKEREEAGKSSGSMAAQMGANTGGKKDIPRDPDTNACAKSEEKFHGLARYGYRPTSLYAFPRPFDGPRLGLAMGISGAAASPNMGFYSSAPVAFLMTLFDVRLGQWLGNPRNPKTWRRATPRFGLTYLLNELFAGTDDEAAYVYLSDGGHFENMGLYELVKRRCGLIIVCDAEADDCYGFTGLGNAIRKCRIDLGIDIDLDVADITPAKLGEPSKKHCAIGTIHYETVDKSAPSGTLIYFKASLTDDESTDVKNYQTMHSQFPHESTGDQWFTESQFESYRELGYHEVMISMNPQMRPGIASSMSPPSGSTPGAERTPADAAAAGSAAAIRAAETAAEIQAAKEAATEATAAEMMRAVREAPWPDAADSEEVLKEKEASKLVPLNNQLRDALKRFGFDISRLTAGG